VQNLLNVLEKAEIAVNENDPSSGLLVIQQQEPVE
jgi:hypothetical protein